MGSSAEKGGEGSCNFLPLGVWWERTRIGGVRVFSSGCTIIAVHCILASPHLLSFLPVHYGRRARSSGHAYMQSNDLNLNWN